jgi:predicted transcriptional regulator
MIDYKFQVPVEKQVEVDVATLAHIDRGIKDADEGRTVPLEEVKKLIPQWISIFKSLKS